MSKWRCQAGMGRRAWGGGFIRTEGVGKARIGLLWEQGQGGKLVSKRLAIQA